MEPPQPNVVKKPKKDYKKTIIVAIASLLVLAGGVVAGLILVRQPQDVREKAAVPSGTAKVFITPETKTVNVGDTFTATVLFDTAGIATSGLTVKLEYSYSGDSPPISATNIEMNSSLVLDGNWDFPYKNISEQNGKVAIEIAGLPQSTQGFTTSGQQNLATITFKANKAGTINVAFNPTETVIASKSDEEDILLIPQSTGVYTVGGGGGGGGQTSTPSPSPTSSPTGSSTPIPTAPPVPQTGIGTSTTIGFIVGILLIATSVAFAL